MAEAFKYGWRCAPCILKRKELHFASSLSPQECEERLKVALRPYRNVLGVLFTRTPVYGKVHEGRFNVHVHLRSLNQDHVHATGEIRPRQSGSIINVNLRTTHGLFVAGLWLALLISAPLLLGFFEPSMYADLGIDETLKSEYTDLATPIAGLLVFFYLIAIPLTKYQIILLKNFLTDTLDATEHMDRSQVAESEGHITGRST